LQELANTAWSFVTATQVDTALLVALARAAEQRPGAARRLFSLFRRAKSGRTSESEASPGNDEKVSPVAAAKLKRAFDAADKKGKGALGLEELQAALRIVATEHRETLQLQRPDEVVARLSKLLLRGDASVQREKFVAKLQRLAARVEAARGTPISEIREILGLGIECFGPADAGDAAADSEEETLDEKFELPQVGRVANAFTSAVQEFCRRKGLDQVGGAIAGVATEVTAKASQVFAGETVEMGASLTMPNPMDMAKRSLEYASEQPEQIQEYVTNTLDVASLLTASSRLALELCSQESLTDFDFSTVVTLLVFVGLSGVYMARDLSSDELADKVPKRV